MLLIISDHGLRKAKWVKLMKKSNLLIRVVIVVLLVYAGVNLVLLRSQTEKVKTESEELREEVDAATQKNEELKYAIEHSTDPEVIEDVARNDIGLVLPGEKIFYDVSN